MTRTDVDVARAWEAFRAEREETLAAEYGWLSLTSLTWLGHAPTTLPDFPGLWSLEAQTGNGGVRVLASFPADAHVTREGEAVRTSVRIDVARGASDISLACGHLRAEVAQRGAGACVRVRDPHAPTRTAFRSVPTWDFDPSWICPAEVTWDSAPSPLRVPSALAELTVRITRLGHAVVTLPNGTHATLVVTEMGEGAGVIFYDETNGCDSSPWRAAPLRDAREAGVGEDGAWVLDFTRATAFPAHFTPYGTCPTPPTENVIPMRVEAGEKSPQSLDTEKEEGYNK